MAMGNISCIKSNQTSNTDVGVLNTHTMSDNVHSGEGNNPDLGLRSLNLDQVLKDVLTEDRLGCRLRSGHHLRKV